MAAILRIVDRAATGHPIITVTGTNSAARSKDVTGPLLTIERVADTLDEGLHFFEREQLNNTTDSQLVHDFLLSCYHDYDVYLGTPLVELKASLSSADRAEFGQVLKNNKWKNTKPEVIQDLFDSASSSVRDLLSHLSRLMTRFGVAQNIQAGMGFPLATPYELLCELLTMQPQIQRCLRANDGGAEALLKLKNDWMDQLPRPEDIPLTVARKTVTNGASYMYFFCAKPSKPAGGKPRLLAGGSVAKYNAFDAVQKTADSIREIRLGTIVPRTVAAVDHLMAFENKYLRDMQDLYSDNKVLTYLARHHAISAMHADNSIIGGRGIKGIALQHVGFSPRLPCFACGGTMGFETVVDFRWKDITENLEGFRWNPTRKPHACAETVALLRCLI